MIKTLLILFLFYPFCLLKAQESERVLLEKQRASLLKKIEETNNLLEEISGNRQVGLLKLRTLNASLRQRSNLVKSINREMFFIEEDMKETEEVITALGNDLEDLKEEYGAMIYLSSKNTASRAYNQILYLFASETFNQLLARYHFLNQYKETRSYQIEQILVVREMLTRKQQQLVQDKETRAELLEREQQDQKEILRLKRQQQQLVANLAKEAKELRAQLVEEKKSVKELQEKITKILQANLKENDPSLRHSNLALTNNEATTDNSSVLVFEAARNRLIWPVKDGFISSRFGRQEHPVLEKIWVDNLGVDITTRVNEPVHAVFEGKVVAVTKVPGMQYMITLQHGEYFTVYARLQEVKVQPGQQVQQLTPLGTVASNADGMAALQFQIWYNQRKLNPEEWLSTD